MKLKNPEEIDSLMSEEEYNKFKEQDEWNVCYFLVFKCLLYEWLSPKMDGWLKFDSSCIGFKSLQSLKIIRVKWCCPFLLN